MRVKQIWSVVPAPAMLKLVWTRITFNKLTTFYFIFSILHCLIQVGFQTRAFMINNEAASFLYNILHQGNAESINEFPALVKTSDWSLRMCNTVPDSPDPILAGQCRVIWDGKPRTNWIGSQPSQAPPPSITSLTSAVTADPSITSALQNALQATSSSSLASTTTTVFVQPTPRPANAAAAVPSKSDDETLIDELERRDFPKVKTLLRGDQTAVTVDGMGFNSAPAVLDQSCLWALNYPVSILHNTKREDIVFICFQVWVLGMSIVAILNESIPHILASLATHVLATVWAVYQIFHTANFRAEFQRTISKGACNGTNLLPNYWKDRAVAEIPALALNGLALISSAILTYRLFKLFGWQTFKRVGASLLINRLYKVVLTLSIIIQLAAFFIVVVVSIWVDQLFNTPLGQQATLLKAYQGGSIGILLLVIPWLVLGWISVRRESRWGMFFFLSLSVLYLCSWSVMFFSWTFRWEFLTWTFFSAMSVVSVFLTFLAFVLGTISRFNFGKGLPRYLAAQEELPGEDFTPYGPGSSDPEKVSFPTSNGPIPTFSATFGSGDQVPVPTRMFPATRQVAPRFLNQSVEPFESSSSERTYTAGSSSDGSLHRSNSTSSGRSVGSIGSYYSYSGHSDTSSNPGPKGNRWVIE